MTTCIEDLHQLTVGGVTYQLRTPTAFDPARMRRVLKQQGVRRPSLTEFRVAALAGVTALAEAVGDAAEGESQCAILEEWYRLLEPVSEDEIDDPDFETRGAEFKRQLAERRERQIAIMPDVMAIEANLERHHPPYRELVADRDYWDEVSQIEITRLLLLRRNNEMLARDPDGMMAQSAYLAIPAVHRAALAKKAMALLSPDRDTEKN